jgi:nucleotide-binding universal stress UspA family protein
MKKILLPTDGSDLGDYAYDLAHRIAKPTQAEIHVFCVVPATANAVFDSHGQIKDDEGEDLSDLFRKRDEWQEKLDAWVADKTDVTVSTVKIGRVEEDILRYVKEESIDLIVMGTSGSYGLDEWLRGSHAQHIGEQSQTPVLSLKCDRSGYVIKDILLVSDFQDTQAIDLRILKQVQEAFQARLNLLRINTPKDFLPQRQIMLRMQAFAENNGLEDVAYHVYSDETVEKGIQNFSADTGIDFVAIGTHQRRGLSRLFKHSVAAEVVNHIWAPILEFPV